LKPPLAQFEQVITDILVITIGRANSETCYCNLERRSQIQACDCSRKGDGLISLTGDLKQAEIEYDRALGLNPNAFDVLKSYSCWAFAFGKGEAGAQAVDRAIRLNPRYPDHGVDCFRYALFMVGRHEDAIRTQRRLPEQKWDPDGFAMTAGSLSALGKLDEAKALAARGYAKFPSVLSVEKFALDRGWSPPESAKLLDLIQKAGFPICAAKADIADNPKIVRLPACK
jgi:tetratricopeptide (TPR) repeat protein